MVYHGDTAFGEDIHHGHLNIIKYIDFPNDKRISLCYNLVKALYFYRASPHNTSIIGAYHFEEDRPLRIILQRTWKFSML